MFIIFILTTYVLADDFINFTLMTTVVNLNFTYLFNKKKSFIFNISYISISYSYWGTSRNCVKKVSKFLMTCTLENIDINISYFAKNITLPLISILVKYNVFNFFLSYVDE